MADTNGAFQIILGRNQVQNGQNNLYVFNTDNITFICFRYALNSLLETKQKYSPTSMTRIPLEP